MANLTAKRDTQHKISVYDMKHDLPLTVGATVYRGGLVATDASGTVVRGGTASSVTVGMSKTTTVVSVSGDRCEYETGIFKFTNGSTAVTAAMRGNLCYADDDQTVSSDETKPIAGIVYDVDSDGVWVLIRPSVARVGAAT